jgi:hypothetical protein
MINWIESQPNEIIALVVFSFAYLAAATIFVVATWVSRRAFGKTLQPITPSLLSPLGTVTGILIVFLAARVWANLDRAKQYMNHEINALRETALLVESLPPDVSARVRAAIKGHVEFIASHEWPAMAEGREEEVQWKATPLEDAQRALLSFSPAKANETLAQSRAMAAIQDALENRAYRLQLSQAEIDTIQWVAILVLAAMMLTLIAAIHLHHSLAMGVSLFAFATAIAICLVLLMQYDQPFDKGGFQLLPTDYRDAMPD